MTMIEDGGPAFPQTDTEYSDGSTEDGAPGMTLRDYFAAKAMVALLHGKGASDLYSGGDTSVAVLSYRMATAMLEERDR